MDCIPFQNGHVLGADEDISSIWNSGLISYTDQNWRETVDMMEEALRLYTHYRNKTLTCIKKCNREGEFLIYICRCSVVHTDLNV